jgi:O-antigen/teichoic acid export membrane protein
MSLSSTGQTVAKNATVLMGAQLITWSLTLLLTIFLPRYLGAAAVGKFHFATSIWAIMTILVTFGMDTLLTKEIARRPERTSDLFGTTIVLRLLLYVVAFGLVTLYLRLTGYPQDTVQVVYVIGLSMLIWEFVQACTASLQGLERMEYISLGAIAGKAFNTALSITLLLMGYGVLFIALVTVGGALVNLLFTLYFLRRLQPLRLSFSFTAARQLLVGGIPYLLSGIFLTLYIKIDIVVISYFVNDTVVGWYGAADQLFGTFLFIPTVFMTAIFPALSRLYVQDSGTLPKLMSKSFDLLLLLSLPIGLGLMVIAGPLVVLLFGPEFTNSGPVLAIFGIVLILTYQNMLLGQFLISTDRQNKWTAVMAVATVVSLVLAILLIPWFQQRYGNGGIGGTVSFVVTESGMMIAGLRLLPKGSLGRGNVWLASRALLAGAGMAAVAWWWRDAFIVLPIVAGAVTYGSLILLLRVVPREDLLLFQKLAHGLLLRLRARSAEPA